MMVTLQQRAGGETAPDYTEVYNDLYHAPFWHQMFDTHQFSFSSAFSIDFSDIIYRDKGCCKLLYVEPPARNFSFTLL